MSVLHNTTKDKILKLLLKKKNDEFSIRSIAQHVKVDYKTVNIMTKRLIGDEVIKAKTLGKGIACSINTRKFNADIFRAEELRREDIFKNSKIKTMTDYLNDISDPFFILLMFGSYAKKTERKKSDIDLLLITDNALIIKKVQEKISILPLDIHLVYFNLVEIMSMLKTTDFNVGKEAFNENVILFGIENYYRVNQYA